MIIHLARIIFDDTIIIVFIREEPTMGLGSDWKKTGKGIGDAFKSIGDDNVNTGSSFGHAFRDLGKTIIKSAKVGVDKADEWANGDDAKAEPAAEAEAASDEKTEEAPAEE